jgi:hypothetical protein
MMEPLEGRLALSSFTVTDNGDSAADPGSLRYAITQVELSSDTSNTIIVNPILAGGQTITLASALPKIATNVSIIGPGASAVSVSGNDRYQVFNIGAGCAVAISGLTITGGSAALGGGIYNDGALTVTDTTIADNSASVSAYGYGSGGNDGSGVGVGTGGGIYNAGALTVIGCTITGNSASGTGYGYGYPGTGTGTGTGLGVGTGGGIYNAGALTVADTTIVYNSASGTGYGYGPIGYGLGFGYGGGICSGSGTVTVTHCTIADDSASGSGSGGGRGFGGPNGSGSGFGYGYGGGIWSGSGTVTVTDSTIADDSAFGSGTGGGSFSGTGTGSGTGGGICSGSGTMTVTHCTIADDSASGSGSGGGILGNGHGYGYGGGISGAVSVIDSTIADDSAAGTGTGVGTGAGVGNGTGYGYGGGISGAPTVTDSTIVGNSASGTGSGTGFYGSGTGSGTGGGIYSAGVMACDSIIAGNSAINAPDFSGAVNSRGNNLVGETDGSTGWIASDLSGTSANPLDPNLAPLGDYGGPTQTMALLPGSPAIGAGIVANDPQGNPIATDQRGEPLDSLDPDIGAFQSQGFTLNVVSGSSPQSAPVGTAFADPVAVTVTANNPVEPVAGGVVTFVAPSSGASASLGATTVVIGSNGQASTTATANSVAGSYTVAVTTAGATAPAILQLNNTAGLTGFSVSWGSSGTDALNLPATSGGLILPAGRQTDLPWLGIDQFTLTLNTAAPLSAGDVMVTSAIGVNYGPVTVSGSGTTYVINLAQPIDQADQVTVTIGNAAVASFSGVLAVLPGDVNDDGVVNSQDLLAVAYQWLGVLTPTIFGDVTGDVTAGANPTEQDYLAISGLIGTTLPPPESNS